jgi:glycine cleavage system H protein
MVPILVLLTFAAFIGAGWLLFQWRRATAEGPSTDEAPRPIPALAAVPQADSPLYLHPGHVWVSVAPDGLAVVGASDFAANFAGALSEVELPREGTRLRQGEPAWTLVSARHRKLTQVMPVDGEVVAVNREILGDLGLINRAPLREGWILKVRPTRLAESLKSLFTGPLADTWKEVAGLRLNAMLAPALGRVAQDGGVWVARFGDMLDDSVWNAMREDLFPTQGASGSK